MTRKWKFYLGAAAAALITIIMVAGFVSHKTKEDGVAQASAPVAVEVTPVSLSTVTATVSSVGTIEAMHDVMVSSETAGRITAVRVKVGDHVRAGEPLVIVDDELKKIAVDQARAQLLAAQTSFDKTKTDYERMQKLLTTGDVADIEVEGSRLAYRSAEAQLASASVGLRAAERQYEDTRIKSPVAGVVASRKVELGEMVSPGKEIANIVDLSAMKVKLSIPEDQIDLVRVGLPATLRVDSRPGEEFAGHVYSVGAKSLSPTVHAYPVEVVVNGNPDVLRVGMFVRTDIVTKSVKDALTISKESLVSDDGKPTVFVVERDTARLRPVSIGVRSGDVLQVLEGLRRGDVVISFGQRDLKDGSPVQVAR